MPVRNIHKSGFGEMILAHRTQGTLEIFGDVLPLGAGCNALIGCADFFVVLPAAQIADILHFLSSPYGSKFCCLQYSEDGAQLQEGILP